MLAEVLAVIAVGSCLFIVVAGTSPLWARGIRGGVASIKHQLEDAGKVLDKEKK